MANSKLKTLSFRSKTISKQQAPQLSKARLMLVGGVLVLGILGLIWRLYVLQITQVTNGKNLIQEARKQQLTKLDPYIPRRQIVDRDNNVLATDRLVYDLYAHPALFKSSQSEIAIQLAAILGDKTSEEILKMFAGRQTGVLLAKNLPESVADKILSIKDKETKLPIDGLDLAQKYSRFYPHQETVADIVGYINLEHRPQAGIEYSQRKLIERPIYTYEIRRTGEGVYIPAQLPNESPTSEDLSLKTDSLRLQLTIDLRLQQAATNALKQTMKKYNAKRGAVIVMDVRDGSIPALVCEPTYNPNRFFEYDVSLFRNWAITDLYEPGSTFKPINVAIALDAGIIKPDDIFYDPGKIKVDGWEILNHDFHEKGGYGEINVTQILEHSSNVGMIKIMSRMQESDFYRALTELGLTEPIEIDLPGYTPGYLKNEIEFTVKSIEAATAAFGQGFSLTPLKLVQLHGAIANGGKLVIPHVVRGLVDPEGNLHWKPTVVSKQVFSPKTTRSVLEMMESVVKKGSGQSSRIPGYRIAGKTGTAQKAASSGGYQANAKITSFVGIFPVESPRYVVLAVVDEPKGQYTFGSTVTAPIVKSVMDALIVIEGIPPSR